MAKTFPILKNRINIDKKKEGEKKLFEKKIFLLMTAIYCKDKVSASKKSISKYKFEDAVDEFIASNPKLCKYKISDNYYKLIKKVFKHTDRCPHSYYKTFCHSCPTRCYKDEDLAQIEPIMKHSGKRILFKHPAIGAKFLINLIKAKKIIKNAR